MRNGALAWLGGLAAWLAGTVAQGAASVRVLVERSAAAQDCPDQQELTARVESILKRPLRTVRPTGEGVEISVRFVGGADGYAAALRFEGEKRGERQLRDAGKNCEALAEAVSTSVALVIEGQAAARDAMAPPRDAMAPARDAMAPARDAMAPARDAMARPASSAAVSTQPPAATPPRPALSASVPGPASNGPDQTQGGARASPDREWTLAASLAGGPAFGFAADIGWGLSGQLHLRGRSGVELTLGARYVFESELAVPPATVHANLWFAALQACYLWGDRVALGPCASYGLGQLHGQGDGYAENRGADLVWSAVGAGIRARALLSRALFVSLGAVVWGPLRSLTFSARNVGVVVRAPPIAGELSAGFGMDFGR